MNHTEYPLLQADLNIRLYVSIERLIQINWSTHYRNVSYLDIH